MLGECPGKGPGGSLVEPGVSRVPGGGFDVCLFIGVGAVARSATKTSLQDEKAHEEYQSDKLGKYTKNDRL